MKKTVTILMLLLACLFARNANAQWSSNSSVNTPVSITSNHQYATNVSDGAGGAIITWTDDRSGTFDIYVQRINASGVMQWTVNGVAICTATGSQQYSTIVSDGLGGAIITWYDHRSGTNDDIYAQRINASGVVQWAANGVAICTATGDQQYPAIAADGSGGAIITWMDTRTSSNPNTYAQRVNASGVVQWTSNGVAICTVNSLQEKHAISSDGSGGAIVTWLDYRYGYDIYAQRIDASGLVQWTTNGIIICHATLPRTYTPEIISDGSGEAIITWIENRGNGSWDVYAQRINASGVGQWAANGVVVCAAAGDQISEKIMTDGSGGAIITWADYRNGNTNSDIYAQRINASGTGLWETNGVVICNAAYWQDNPTIVSDGSGGAIITWNDFRNNYFMDIYAQRINASGTVQWTTNGVVISNASGDKANPIIVADASGGAIINWTDVRSYSDLEIYAQHVSASGSLVYTTPLPTITSFSPESGAIGSSVTITGTGFNTTAAQNIVFFGATQAVVTAASATSLTVTVPLGATYQYLSVTNLAAQLTAYSAKPFIVTLAGNILFASKVDFATGSTPMSISIGDIDGNGKSDLVVANYDGNTISVLRNTSTSGNVSFAAKADFATGSHPRSANIGDIDGDGKADLAVANGSSNTVSVLRNTSTSGNVSFADKADFATGSVPFSVSIGDIDGDGKADLALANYDGNTISVLRNTSSSGSLSFAAKADFTTGSSPRSVSIGDIDGDGKADLAVANSGSNTVSVLRNTSAFGNVSFAAKADFATGSTPYSVSIGDIDGDSKADLAVANYDGNTVSVLRNTSTSGTVSFASKVDLATGTGAHSYPFSVSTGDIDGDGKPDLAVANYGSNAVSVLGNTSTLGNLSFATKVNFATGTQPYAVSIGDIDGDGKPDLAVANSNFGTNTLSVIRQITPPTITSFTPTSGPTGTTVTITGTDFTGATAVSFGGTAATSYTVVSATSITAIVASGTTGTISVTTQGGTTISTDDFTYVPSPTITSFTPTTAGTGTTVSITGTHFTGATAVSFGGTAAADFIVDNDNTISAIVADGTTGTVSVTTPGGTATSTGSFTFKPSFLTNLGNKVSSSSSANTANYYGQAFRTGSNGYTLNSVDLSITLYGADAVVKIYSDVSSYMGSEIATLSGTYVSGNIYNFTSATPVTLAANTSYWLVLYSTDYTYFDNTDVMTYTGTGTIPTTHRVAFSTDAGANWGYYSSFDPSPNFSSPFMFSLYGDIIPAPTITSFTPTSAASGTTVTITGTNFTGATVVSFGGTAATSFTVVSATSITAVVANGTSGSVSVTTPGGTASRAGFTYIDCTSPSIGSQSTAAQTKCLNGAFDAITVTATGTGISYQWFYNASESNSGGTSLGTSNGADTYSYTPQSGIAGTLYYYCVVTGTCGTATSAISGAFIVRPAFTPGAISATGETICYNTSPTTEIGSTTDAGGGDNSITYSWRSSTDSYAAAISGATSATYTPAGPLTSSTSYKRYAKDNTCNTTPEVSTGTWTITVLPTFIKGAIATTGETICYNTTPTTEIGSTTDASGGDNSITYSWKSTADDYNTAISGATLSTYTPAGPLTTTTSYKRFVKDNTCKTTPIVSTGTWTVTVRDNFTAGEISATGETICYNGNPAEIGSTTAASGGNNVITYQWQSSTNAGFSTPTDINSNSATYDPPAGLTVTTWYRRQAKDGVCNTSWNTSAEVWKVTVYDQVVAGIAGTTTGCVSVSLTATGGGTYLWSTGSTPSTAINTFTTGGTYTVSVTVSVNGCLASTSQEITVIPQPAAPTNTTPLGNLTINAGNNTVLSASVSGASQIGWYDAAVGGNYLGMNSSYTTYILNSTTTFYVQSLTCIASPRTAITVTVIPVSYEQTIGLTLEAREDVIAPLDLSCPYIYTWDGSSYVKDNDIYSVARFPYGEYRDSYALQKPLVADGGKYKLQISEIATEESYTDYVGLVAVDHDSDVKIAPDNQGRIFAYKPANLISPVSAVSNTGTDVLNLVNQDNDQGFNAYSEDYIDINFGNVDIASGARMVLKVKGFNEGLGVPKPFVGPPAIVVQININGIWTEVGRLRPRVDWDECVFDISTYAINPANGVKVRLYSISHGVIYSIIDYVALETGVEPTKTVTNLAVSNASFSGNSVTNLLNVADNQYVHMSPNNQMNIEFDAPTQSSQERSFVFVSEGFYIPLTNTFYICTWNGSSWVSRYASTYPTYDQIRTFDLSPFLPDPNNEMKVRIYQDYSGATTADIDYVHIQINSTDGVLKSAKDLRNNQDILSYVNTSNDTRFTLASGFGYTGGADRWSEYNFGPGDPTSVSATINPICYGTSSQLTAHGTQGVVSWYTGSCGGTLVATVNPYTVSPTSTTTYYAKNTIGGYSAGCASITVTVNPITAVISQSTASHEYCIDGTSTPISVSADGTGTITYQWYSNTVESNTGGTWLGSSNGAQTNTYTPLTSTASTLYYYCVIHSDCGVDVTSPVSGAIIVYPNSVGGSILGTSSITYGSSTGTLTLGSYVGTIQRWEKKLSTDGSWTQIAHNDATYEETPNAGIWKYRVLVKSGVCSETYSDVYTVTVNPKPLNITADNKSKNYDGLVYSPFTVTYNGFVLGQSSTSLGGTLAFSGSATTSTDVGAYTIIPSGLTSTNYAITYYNGTLIINCNSTVYVKNNSGNNDIFSLRRAIANVCEGGTVIFEAGLDGQTITLLTSGITINKNIKLNNCAHNTSVTVSGINPNFTINATKSITLLSCGSTFSKVTVGGTILNNAGVSGLVIESSASLIQNTANLPATAKRALSSAWHLFGSPFQQSTGATLSNINTGLGTVQLKPYTNGTNWLANVTSPLYFLQPTVGYAVCPSTAVTASLSGNLFNGLAAPCDYSIPLTYNGTAATQSWNLIANPFPSYLDWNALGKTNISTTIYYWNPTAIGPPVTNTSYFSVYNAANNVGVPMGTSRYISPMQGFFVRAIYTTPKITLPLAARTHSSGIFYKEADNTEILVRLKTETEMGMDELVICKNPEAKLAYEDFDSEKMFDGLPVGMFSLAASGEKLVINTISDTNTIIPLTIMGSAGDKAKITAFDLESSITVYLEDRLKGKITNLSENSSYSFEFLADEVIGRFFIRFNNSNAPLTASNINVFETNQKLNIIAQTGEEIQEVEVFTLTGACVFKTTPSSSNVFSEALNLSSAIYLVKVKTSLATKNVKVSWE